MKTSERLVEGKTEPELVEIKEVVEENTDTKSFIMNKHVDAVPGQFAMLWLPGVDEKPMSFSGVGSETRFTVRKVGPFSERLHELVVGEEIGLRGPYGRGFSGEGKDVCLVSGGCGAAPLLPLAKTIEAKNITIILAAQTKTRLLFVEEFSGCGGTTVVTDDGSAGRKGNAVDVLAETLLMNKFDRIYACGPEAMLSAKFTLL